MSLWNLLILVTVASSFILLTQRCLYALAALIASGIAALMAFDVVSIRHDTVPLLLATIIGVVGVVAYVRSTQKNAIGAAAVLAVVGGVQVVTLLELL